MDTSKVYSQGKHFIGPDYEFKTFRADAHLVNLYRINAFTQDKLEVRFKVGRLLGSHIGASGRGESPALILYIFK